MRAHLNGTVIAEAPESDLVKIEGNWYFPPASVNQEYVTKSPAPYTCAWKGECQFYTITMDGQPYQDRAFSYDDLRLGAVARVRPGFTGNAAFWKEITVED